MYLLWRSKWICVLCEREMDWLQLPLHHKCHVLSESQCVKVGFIIAWVDEACQHSVLAVHYAVYVHHYCDVRDIHAAEHAKKMGLGLKPVVHWQIYCDKNYFSKPQDKGIYIYILKYACFATFVL